MGRYQSLTVVGALGGLDAVDTAQIDDDAVTYSKMQNVAADERLLGRVSGADGIVEELTKNQALTLLNVEDGATAGGSNVTNIFLPVEAAYLPDANPAALAEELGATVYGGYSYLAFDDSIDEHAVWRVPMPDYDGGNIIFKFYWFAVPTSGDVAWNIESIGVTDGEEIISAVVTDAVEVTADTVTGNTLDLNITTHATYNPASVAADDMMVIEITRDVSRDDMAADARLFGILLEYTRS